jgi:tRNA 5-methylaminomethyl-2-thiouridine biosynthesis bifunctional protein
LKPVSPPFPSGIDPLCWDSEGRPLSSRFQDFYFSHSDGAAETEYVYLQHNQLPQRWQTLRPGQAFSIGETGFGTGLNFLSCWHRWRQHAPADARLHFVSAELHPLSREDLRLALALWPELTELSEALIAQYPPACAGFHRLQFDEGRVQLTLIFEDACRAFELLDQSSQFDKGIDAWFLDGFSPAKNPQMWRPELFSALARRSHPQTSFSTFTAAANVRRGLEAAGFAVSIAPGFGKKRELLYGRYQGAARPLSAQPWFDRPTPQSRQQVSSDSTLDGTLDGTQISIIGAGLAGACSAFALAERGCKVELFERGAHPGCGASGAPQGALYAKLPAVPTFSSRIHLNGYLYSLRLLQRQLPQGEHWSPCGVIQLALNAKEADKQQKLLSSGHYPPALVQPLTKAQASTRAGVPLTAGGLLFPQAGWVSPAALCSQLLSHPNISCHFNQQIEAIHFDAEQQQWQLRDPKGALINQAATLIVATAHEAKLFPALAELPLKAIRGQTSTVKTASTPLKTVLCGNGYISPAKQQAYCFGASFDINDPDTRIRDSDHLHNLRLVEELSPSLAQQLEPQLPTAEGRVGFRCAAPDYLPLVGPAPDPGAFRRDYAPLSRNAKANIEIPPTHLPGLFVSLGHGSKGLITAPLAGALLADLILDEPAAIERELLQALNPARFMIKKIIKQTV